MNKVILLFILLFPSISIFAQEITLCDTAKFAGNGTWNIFNTFSYEGRKYIYCKTEYSQYNNSQKKVTIILYDIDGNRIANISTWSGNKLRYVYGDAESEYKNLYFTQTLWNDDEDFEYLDNKSGYINICKSNGDVISKIYPPEKTRFVTDGYMYLLDLEEKLYLSVYCYDAAQNNSALYEIVKDKSDGVANVKYVKTLPIQRFDINGIKHDVNVKGLNIVRESDGSVKKFISK